MTQQQRPAVLGWGYRLRGEMFVKALVKTFLPSLALLALLGWRKTCKGMVIAP